MLKRRIVIIGSGIGGIAAAIRLAIKGYDVTVTESNAYPGGKLSEINEKGFRFDAGPSLFTIPHYVDELFELAGENPKDWFTYKRLPIICNYFYEDGTQLNAFADNELFAQEINKKTGEPSENVIKALENSKFLYRYLGNLFIRRPIHSIKTFISKEAFKSYIRIPRLDFFRTMDEANKSFFNSDKVRQLFNRYATYNGSDPYSTPATMNIIPHLEFNQGAFFPKKGMHDITQSLYQLALRKGVNFEFNQKVSNILVKNKRAVGVTINNEDFHYDAVVSNMDIVNTYRKLIPKEKQPNFLLNQPKSSSALIFYWGVKGSYKNLDLHNIFFSENYESEFDHIFNQKDLYEDPTVYINITSKCKADDAPKGHENWFTMINVPNNDGQDWDLLIEIARQNIIQKINRILQINLKDLIVYERILDPISIETKTSSSRGALYGNSSNNRYSAFLRHANFSRKIKNLYFCGGSVHPGGGIPLSLSSAKLVADHFPKNHSK